MATMMDQMPSEYEGEMTVWKSIKENLPNDIVCYYTREVKGREFAFCLLITDIGLLIIEVKGWNKRPASYPSDCRLQRRDLSNFHHRPPPRKGPIRHGNRHPDHRHGTMRNERPSSLPFGSYLPPSTSHL